MSSEHNTRQIGNLDLSASPNLNLARFIEQARQAYEHKRTKDCLDLTRAILLVDPENVEAQLMRSSIQSEMHQDLENARALLRYAQPKDNLDSPAPPAITPLPETLPVDVDTRKPAASLRERPPAPLPRRRREIVQPKKPRWFRRATVIVCVGVVVVGLPRFRNNPDAVQVPANLQAWGGLPQNPGGRKLPETVAPSVAPEIAPSLLPSAMPSLTLASATAVVDSSANVQPRPSPNPPVIREKPAVPPANGTLAISSPTSVDIFLDDAYLGSAPVSLELPAGKHTLEYRHGNLRMTQAHIVNSNQTTKATVTFDVPVQVNAKPWAEVFLDGVERKPLGQTPLSVVRVPIGGVLVFENPEYPAKKYRVTGRETGIQIVFP
jgi:hypothetical protein